LLVQKTITMLSLVLWQIPNQPSDPDSACKKEAYDSDSLQCVSQNKETANHALYQAHLYDITGGFLFDPGHCDYASGQMSLSVDADRCGCDFVSSYEQSRLPIMREVERSVLGCDYGGTSWTTRVQADGIAKILNLQAGVNHLDVGSGSGWPALFLARSSGCDVTLVDIPMIALSLANQRVAEEGLDNQCRAIVASGAALPFAAGAFDSLSHSDVLCCLPEKMEMLQECRRVVRSQAAMLFTVISISPGLAQADYAQAVEAGPPFIEAPAEYSQMVRESGWRIIGRQDVTADFAVSLRTLVATMTARADEIAAAIGADELLEQKQHRQSQILAVEKGLLKREIFHCLAV